MTQSPPPPGINKVLLISILFFTRVANRGARKASSEDTNQPLQQVKHEVDEVHRRAYMGTTKPSRESPSPSREREELLPGQGASASGLLSTEGYPAAEENRYG